MSFSKYVLSPEHGVVIPGFGAVTGEFTMFEGSGGSYHEPPEDPHLEDYELYSASGQTVKLSDLEDGILDALEGTLYGIAEKAWSAEARDRAADTEAYAQECCADFEFPPF
jgi:hypothetical protein